MLKQLHVDFYIEFSPDWCRFKFKNKIRKGKYDFYFELNNKRYIIETDGGFHKKLNTLNGQSTEESQFIDGEKDKLAFEHNIDVIRIDCSESKIYFIKNKILSSNLRTIFDLNKVNWLKCEEYSLSNLVKEVCKIKYYYPNFTTTDI
jgi:very-short-patch-repair endonuclease